MNKQVSLIILCGGKSSRMGMPKQNLKFGDSTFLEALIKKGENLYFNEIIISGKAKYDNYRNVEDVYEDIGPIGGIYSCLKASHTEDVLILAVDTPQIQIEVIQELINEYFKSKNQGTDCMFLSNNGYKEPLISMWNKSCLKILEDAVLDKKYSVLKVTEKLRVSEYQYEGDIKYISGFNTLEEYNEINKIL